MTKYGHTISWPDERRQDHLRRKHSSLLNQTINWGLQWGLLMIGSVLVSILACAIDIVSNFLLSLKSGHCENIWYASHAICCMEQTDCPQWKSWSWSGPIYFVLSIVFVLAAFLAVAVFPHTAMSGIPELKGYFYGYTMPTLLGNGPLISKSIALTFSVASGLWVGIEGPLVHIATLCTSFGLDVLGIPMSQAGKRDVIMASSAGGLCLSFNAPLAGILFVLEVFKIRDHSVLWKGFVCAMVASVVYESIDPMRTGKQMFFHVTYDRVWHAVELFFFVLLAIICGSIGALITYLNGVYTRWRRRELGPKYQPVYQVLAVATITAVLTLPNDLLARSHQLFLRNLYQECKIYHTSGLCDEDKGTVTLNLIYALFVSVFLTIVTYGIAVPAGIILPVLLTGAITGRIFGIAMHKFANSWDSMLSTSFCPADRECITPGVYALVGAAACLTGTTKLTVSAVVLLFEMTGALSYVVPIMTGVMVAKWVSDSLGVPSIYDMWVEIEAYPVDQSKGPVPNLTAHDVMKSASQLHVARLSDSTEQLRQLLRRNLYGFPVLGENNQLIGFITHKRLERVMPQDDLEVFSLEDHLSPAEMYQLNPNASLLTVKNYMDKLGMHTVLFVDRSELQGLMTQIDMFRVMDRQQRGPPLLHREISYRQSLDRVLTDL